MGPVGGGFVMKEIVAIPVQEIEAVTKYFLTS